MTTSSSPVQLGPFQRAALELGSVAYSLTVSSSETTGSKLYEAVLAVLTANPALRAELVLVESVKVPCQRLADVHGRPSLERARWEIAAGSTRVEIAEHAGRCFLTLSVLPVFADQPSLVRVVELVCGVLAGASVAGGAEAFAVESGHMAMLRGGELSAEERYWRARRDETEVRSTHGYRLDDVLPSRDAIALTEARRALDGSLVASAAALAASADAQFEDVAYLAMWMVLDRLGVEASRVERTVDARAVMGLRGAIGVFCHAVPAHVRINATEDIQRALAGVADTRRIEDDLVGCPSPRPGGGLPEVVFTAYDPRPALPRGWRVEAHAGPPAGQIEFAVGDSGEGRELVVRVEDAKRIAADTLVRLWDAALANLTARANTTLERVVLSGDRELLALARELREMKDRPAARDFCAEVVRQAATDSSRPAVIWAGGAWSFGDFLARVRRVAAEMQAVSAGDVVAVVATSDQPELILGLVSVLWRGAAFIPIDPDEPPARVTDALVRSRAVMVLTAVEHFTTATGVPVLALDRRAPGARSGPDPVAVSSATAAYILRTSGSTGRPKLVAISRGSLVNYLRWVAEEVTGPVVGSRVLPALSPAVFDASFKQTLGMLYSGRPVWLLAADRRDVDALLTELAACPHGLVINCVPSYWSALLNAASDRPLPRIEKVLLGGEVVTSSLLDRTRRALPAAEVWNLYGPTEATATATMGILDGASIHVGRPIAGAILIVLDRYGAPLPAGVAGEVAIAGPGVAIGYLSSTDAASPFTTIAAAGTSAPVYRTGDYGWLDSDGALHIVGRRDAQVKINGWRIELGEVESAAEQLRGIGRAVAVVDGGVLRLFIIGSVAEESVRAGLAGLLPAPMVPSSVHVVTRFPTLPSGKVDRDSLIATLSASSEEDPRVYDPEQLRVATVWKDLLSGGWPRITDDFFAAGGHSLLLAQLVNRLRAQGLPQLSVRHIIRRPTVERIAAAIRAGTAELP